MLRIKLLTSLKNKTMSITNYKLPPPSFNVSPKKDIGGPDGDTIKIEQPIRMVSCDTPEKEKPFGTAATAQPKLNTAKQRLLQNGFFPLIPKGLAKYLADKITPDAAKRHINAGKDASAQFEIIKNKALNKPNGKRRKVGVLPSGEVIDSHGRMLAYIMTYFEKPLPAKDDPARKTYNLLMVENGWAVFFPIWPSLPKAPKDFDIIFSAAKKAWNTKKGMWNKYGSNLLLPYEYRLLIKLSIQYNSTKHKNQNNFVKVMMDNAFQRLCVDLRTMKLVGKFDFYKVPPSHRFWIWEAEWKKNKAQIKSILGVKE
jgi:endonuclease YncB( thermonuclease family)